MNVLSRFLHQGLGMGLILMAVVSLACATSYGAGRKPVGPPLQSVTELNLESYLGRWFEIASFPQAFQKGCTATTAEYSLRENGLINVYNSCRKGSLEGELSDATGKAFIPDEKKPGELRVSFFWPFTGDYWVIELGEKNSDGLYSYAVVGHPKRTYLWILSRTRRMDEKLYQEILERLRTVHSYDLQPLNRTLQPDESQQQDPLAKFELKKR